MPYRTVTLAPRYALRIEDFTVEDLLRVRCEGCGKTWHICADLVLARFPKYQRILDITASFRCTVGAWQMQSRLEAAEPPISWTALRRSRCISRRLVSRKCLCIRRRR